ncbi:MAG: hypothetical protein U9R53_05195 [Chloroflexota bacterium]|nr:hypothetical protein [Chloroflexota bacterium]
MGYVHLTDICQFISPFAISKSAGTWTPTVSSDAVSDLRTPADAAFDLLIPLVQPGSDVALQGARIRSIDVWYVISVAAADDFATVEIDKMTLAANTVACTGTNPPVTIDADHDTAAERKAAAAHKMTVTLDTPCFIEDDTAYFLHLNVDAAATTVFALVGAQVNYDLRL